MTKAAKAFLSVLATIFATLAFTSCEDTGAEIGSSLVTDESEVVIFDDFSVEGVSVDNPRIQSRTITQVLGRINAKGYGTFSSDFMTQFMPSSKMSSNITAENIDSLKLLLFVPNGSYVGDSLAPMGLEVYRLNKILPATIYSNESPEKYYNPSDLLASKIYACNAQGANDSIQALTYRVIDVMMPKSLAVELFNLYQTNPEAYMFPTTFAEYFPGIYVKNSYGNGRVVEISSTIMRMYYHTTSTDSEGEETITRHEGNYYAVTPEIVLNNHLDYTISNELQTRIDDGEQIIVAPVGRDIEIKFPIEELIDYYNSNSGSLAVVNTLTFEIPAEAIKNDYGIDPPENLLLIQSSKKDDFFLRNELADNVTSFYATYDSTNHRYRFTGMRNYLIDMLKKTNVTEEDYTFTLTPVTVESEVNSSGYYGSTTYVSAIDPYIGAPTMVKLNLDEATVKLTFAKQTLN